MEAYWHQGRIRSFRNRRLWCLRMFQSRRPEEPVFVRVRLLAPDDLIDGRPAQRKFEQSSRKCWNNGDSAPVVSHARRLRLGDISYSQNSIMDRFQDRRPLNDLIESLIADAGVIDQVQSIRVVLHEGKWFSLDNRRLYCFKQAFDDAATIGVKAYESPLYVAEEWEKKYTTSSSGVLMTPGPVS